MMTKILRNMSLKKAKTFDGVSKEDREFKQTIFESTRKTTVSMNFRNTGEDIYSFNSTVRTQEQEAILTLPAELERLKKKEVARIAKKYVKKFLTKRDIYDMFVMIKLLIGSYQAYNQCKRILYEKYVRFGVDFV
jgi:hypothetical protein